MHVVAEQENGVVRVSVRDEGLGIPEDQQERVFVKFFRGDAPASGIPNRPRPHHRPIGRRGPRGQHEF